MNFTKALRKNPSCRTPACKPQTRRRYEPLDLALRSLKDKSSFCGGNSTKATSGINGAGPPDTNPQTQNPTLLSPKPQAQALVGCGYNKQYPSASMDL